MKNTQTRFRFTSLLVCGLATAFVSLAGVNAFAASETDGTFSVRVQYSQLELNTEAGALNIYNKIKGAARRVCRMASESWDLARVRHYRQCYEVALAKAVNDVNSRNLTALHQLGTKQKHPG